MAALRSFVLKNVPGRWIPLLLTAAGSLVGMAESQLGLPATDLTMAAAGAWEGALMGLATVGIHQLWLKIKDWKKGKEVVAGLIALVAVGLAAPVDAQPTPPEVPVPQFQVRLTWTAPTTNTDGSPLTNLAGYEIVFARDGASTYSDPISVPADRVAHTLTQNQLDPNTRYWFLARSYNALGVRSDWSNTVSAETPDVRKPGAPGDVVVEILFPVNLP